MHVYIDESGDLGFSPRSTRFFVIAYLNLDYPFETEILMKRLLKRLHQRRKYARGCNELKYSNSKDTVKQIVLGKICQCDLKIGLVVLEKTKVHRKLRRNRTKLYNYIIVDKVLRKILPELNSTDRLNVIIDRSLSRPSRKAFNDYLREKASWLLTVEWGQPNQIVLSNIEVQHRDSQREPCLQATDFLAGACFHKYEHNDDCFFQIIENRVEYFDYLWK